MIRVRKGSLRQCTWTSSSPYDLLRTRTKWFLKQWVHDFQLYMSMLLFQVFISRAFIRIPGKCQGCQPVWMLEVYQPTFLSSQHFSCAASSREANDSVRVCVESWRKHFHLLLCLALRTTTGLSWTLAVHCDGTMMPEPQLPFLSSNFVWCPITVISMQTEWPLTRARGDREKDPYILVMSITSKWLCLEDLIWNYEASTHRLQVQKTCVSSPN